MVPDVTVSKDESSMSIQQAVNSAPDKSERRFVIHIKAGVYKEIVRVPPSKTNLMFVGDGMGKTVITGLCLCHPCLVFQVHMALQLLVMLIIVPLLLHIKLEFISLPEFGFVIVFDHGVVSGRFEMP